MARGVNKVILLGNLGRDPEVRYTAGGAAVTSVSIATTEAWRDRNSGEMQERTEWHNIVFFSRLAEIAGEYLRKGSQIYIEGSLRTQRYTDRNGVERFRTEVIASELQMLGSASGGGNRGGGDSYGDFNQDRPQQGQGGAPQQNYQQPNPNQPAPQSQTQSQQQDGFKSPTREQESSMPDFDTFDDDIPF